MNRQETENQRARWNQRLDTVIGAQAQWVPFRVAAGFLGRHKTWVHENRDKFEVARFGEGQKGLAVSRDSLIDYIIDKTEHVAA